MLLFCVCRFNCDKCKKGFHRNNVFQAHLAKCKGLTKVAAGEAAAAAAAAADVAADVNDVTESSHGEKSVIAAGTDDNVARVKRDDIIDCDDVKL